MKLKVGIIFGGKSVEHEISIISALQAINNIDKEKYEVVPIYISRDKVWYVGNELSKIENYQNIDSLIKKCKSVCLCKINDEFCLLSTQGITKKIIDKIDIAFPIVHGKNVEDGTLAGLLETIGIPYVGSKVIGMALGQDKVILKQVLRDNGIPIVDYIWFYDYEYINNPKLFKKKIKELGYPVIVKPASLGSSIGITYVENEKIIESAISDAIAYDSKILVEKAVDNLIELNCSVMGNYCEQQISDIEEVISHNNILTYEDKYIDSNKKHSPSKGMLNTNRIIPTKISKDIQDEVNNLSKSIFKILNLSGICRIDFLLDNNTKKIYVNEPNIIPGSLAFYLWESKGKKYKELLNELIEGEINNYKKSLSKINSFDINLLKDFKRNNCIKNKKVLY